MHAHIYGRLRCVSLQAKHTQLPKSIVCSSDIHQTSSLHGPESCGNIHDIGTLQYDEDVSFERILLPIGVVAVVSSFWSPGISFHFPRWCEVVVFAN